MGGHAFSKLYTPRMPPAVYNLALCETERRLSKLFSQVAHPIEGPEKRDHGDLDILVLADSTTNQPSTKEITDLLDATTATSTGERDAHFALPWPEASQISPTTTPVPDVDSSARENDDLQSKISPSEQQGSTQRYIQLDLHVVHTPAELEWHLFNNAHGDFVNIISAVLRPKGFTITDKAFCIRIAELEKQHRKLCRVELTYSPNEVLKYLGMDPDRFWLPFRTRTELYEYLLTCRLFDPKPLLHKFANIDVDADAASAPQSDVSLNKFDEQTRMTRPVFASFFREFLPARPDLQPGSCAHLARSELVEDAFAYFGPSVRTKYYARKNEITTNLARTNLWADLREAIRSAVPEITDHHLERSIKALKREILAPLPQAGGCPTPVQTAYTSNDFAAVIEWCVEHYEEACTRYQDRLGATQSHVIDESKTNKYSNKEAEIFTPADDAEIVAMKAAGHSWNNIIAAIGKSSRSQVIGRWKDLQHES